MSLFAWRFDTCVFEFVDFLDIFDYALCPEMTPNQTRNFPHHILPLMLYCGAIFFFSSAPSPLEGVDGIGIPHLDKLAHLAAYAPLGILFFRVFELRWDQDHIRHAIFISILSASVYGATDELHQYFVPSRTCDILDWAADTVGGAMGVVGYCRIRISKVFSLTK